MMPEEKHVASYEPPPDLGPQIVRFTLMRDGQQVAAAQMEQLWVADGMQQIKVKAGSAQVRAFCVPVRIFASGGRISKREIRET